MPMTSLTPRKVVDLNTDGSDGATRYAILVEDGTGSETVGCLARAHVAGVSAVALVRTARHVSGRAAAMLLRSEETSDSVMVAWKTHSWADLFAAGLESASRSPEVLARHGLAPARSPGR